MFLSNPVLRKAVIVIATTVTQEAFQRLYDQALTDLASRIVDYKISLEAEQASKKNQGKTNV